MTTCAQYHQNIWWANTDLLSELDACNKIPKNLSEANINLGVKYILLYLCLDKATFRHGCLDLKVQLGCALAVMLADVRNIFRNMYIPVLPHCTTTHFLQI